MSSGFISENDLAERRKVKNEEWQKSKTDNDPEEPPEEEEIIPDHRTLYDRLQEQKTKKQEDWDEAHKLKNMVRGLEDDEVDFLELVDNTKLQEEKRIKQEEISAIAEYRKKVSEMQLKVVESDVLAELKSDCTLKKSTNSQGKKSQLSLIANAIRPKRKKDDDDDDSSSKKQNTDTSDLDKSISTSIKEKPRIQTMECVAVLPGLGVYTDSSDSENDSDSDVELQAPAPHGTARDLTGRLVKLAGYNHKGCC